MRLANIICTIFLAISIGIFMGFNIYIKKTVDTEGPVIEMDQEEIEISVEDDPAAILNGVHAIDKKDGDVSERMILEDISEFDEEGKRTVTIAAFDNDNHVTKATRLITYSDYVSPHFMIKLPMRFEAYKGDIDIMGRVYANDCLDGNISGKIMFGNDALIYTTIAGEYKMLLSVMNSAKDTAEIPVTVTVYDKDEEEKRPQIYLSDYLIYVKKGESPDLYAYIEGVTWDDNKYDVTDGEGTFGVETDSMSSEELIEYREKDPTVSIKLFRITDNVDYNTPGTYEVKYEIDDYNGETGSVYLTVVVEGE